MGNRYPLLILRAGRKSREPACKICLDTGKASFLH